MIKGDEKTSYPAVRGHLYDDGPVRNPNSSHSSDGCRKGFSISSLPSSGDINTSNVPRATINPKDLVVSFPSSSRRFIKSV